MDAARLNFSHGTHEDHARGSRSRPRGPERERLAGRWRSIADLQGPKLRVGDARRAARGRERRASSSSRARTRPSATICRSRPSVIGDVLQAGPRRADRRRARAAARRGASRTAARAAPSSSAARSGSHKGVNLPGVPLPIPSLTRKDLERPRVRARARRRLRRALVRALRRRRARPPAACSRSADSTAHVIAKIEKAEAVDALDDILAETRRGDGRARRPRRRDRRRERCRCMQKRIIAAVARAREAGDHRDADARVDDPPRRADARRGERRRERDPRRHLGGHALGRDRGRRVPGRGGAGRWTGSRARSSRTSTTATRCRRLRENADVGRAMSNAACDLAEALGARAILVPTFTGRTASAVARLRPRRPIVGLTPPAAGAAADGARVGRARRS